MRKFDVVFLFTLVAYLGAKIILVDYVSLTYISAFFICITLALLVVRFKMKVK